MKKNVWKIPTIALALCLTCFTLFACNDKKCQNSETPSEEIPYDPTVPAHDHAFGEWTTTKAVTCTEPGERTRVCSICGYREKEDISALGHNFVGTSCARCGMILSETAGLIFELKDDHTCALTGYSGNAEDVVVLSSHSGIAVTSIAGTAFVNNDKIKAITIVGGSNAALTIERGAICGCPELTSLFIPNNVIEINTDLTGNEKLTSITVDEDNSVYRTVDGVLHTKDKKVLIKYPEGKNNTNFVFPDETEAVSAFAFGKNNIKTLSVTADLWGFIKTTVSPENVVITKGAEIPGSAFENKKNMISITIPDSVTSIGEYAFYCCSGLTSVTIPDSVMSIGEHAFSYCSGLTSITIPDSVTSIGDYAFEECSRLTSVTIPDSVTSIGDSVFRGCSGLTSITIPDSVTSIGMGAFAGCSGLTSVTIPDSVTSIGMGAFFYCTGLTSITIPDSVTSIGDLAFSGCRGLMSITFPDGVTSIGMGAFFNCIGLTNIAIPDSVTSIGDWAFYSCKGLTSITFTGTKAQWRSISKGSSWNGYTGAYTIHCTDGDISK